MVMSDRKHKKSLLNDVFKYSKKSREEFFKPIDDQVIEASEVFKAKMEHDKWWKAALERVNRLNGAKKDEKEDE